MSITSLTLSFLAGTLTTLSPCVLPVLPFVLSSSLSKHKLGPLFLGLGLLTTFVGSTIVLNSTGYIFGLTPDLIRKISSILLGLSGLFLLSQNAQDLLTILLSKWTSKLAKKSENNSSFTNESSKENFNRLNNSSVPSNIWKQILFFKSEWFTGFILGFIWTPCSGPSLGIALGLAGQQETWMQAVALLFIFGMGAVIPLLAFAYGAQALLKKMKSNMHVMNYTKKVFGLLMFIFSILIYTNMHRYVEASINGILPDFWIDFIKKF